MQFNQNIPIWLQISNEVKKRILKGDYSCGDKLPSVRDFAEELKVNPNTIARVYQELEREMITETRRGTGTFISGDTKMQEKIRTDFSVAITENFIKEMRETGFSDDDIVHLVEKFLEEQK